MPVSLEQNLVNIANAIGADVKALRTADGNLASLSTTAKTNLVAAINEVYGLVAAASGGSEILDTATDGDVTHTWSANKIFDELNAAISSLRNELRAGAGAALDTFAEVAAQLAADESAASALATAVGFRVRFDAAQTLTAPQKVQANANMGSAALVDTGDLSRDLVAVYTTAKA